MRYRPKTQYESLIYILVIVLKTPQNMSHNLKTQVLRNHMTQDNLQSRIGDLYPVRFQDTLRIYDVHPRNVTP